MHTTPPRSTFTSLLVATLSVYVGLMAFEAQPQAPDLTVRVAYVMRSVQRAAQLTQVVAANALHDGHTARSGRVEEFIYQNLSLAARADEQHPTSFEAPSEVSCALLSNFLAAT